MLAELQSGHIFPRYQFSFTDAQIDAYVNAVGDASPPAKGGPNRLVPPMAVIAAGLSHMIETLGLAAGTIHASQEADFERPVRAGIAIFADTVLKANSVRRGTRFATVETAFFDARGNRLARSLSTVIVPV
ncbi:MAG: MaoC family dehydratase N-terminal domain-containing protein [Chloroflexi bacterium]|nr:MaoC family dehydratase N-terminal domain-containing protein [Chloroflexota bacterium]